MRMKWIGKLTGGLLGAVALGPIGAALGVLLGHQFDEHGEELQAGPFAGEDVAAIGERFFRATFRVMGCLAKADGRVSELEISAARAVMGELRLDGPQVREAIACLDRKSTRLNSSHSQISYAVFCLKKKKKHRDYNHLTSAAM